MPIELHDDAAQLLFDPRFAPIYRFLVEAAGDDLLHLRVTDKGYQLSVGHLSTLGERYVHLAWRHLRYWGKEKPNPPKCIERMFTPELDALSASLPNTIVNTIPGKTS